MNELIIALDAVDNYLRGKGDSDLINAFSYYDDHILQLDEDFFREKINLYSNDDLSKKVNNILTSLEIPDEQKGRYTNLTIDDFLRSYHFVKTLSVVKIKQNLPEY